MEKHLFLTGPTGCGKSSLIKNMLGPRLREAGGFITEAMYGGYGELCGFTLSPAAAAGGVSGYFPERYLDCTVFPPTSDNEVFRGTGVRLLEEAVWYPYVLLDEIGGYELIIPQFRAALETTLRTDMPIIGALKLFDEAEAMRQALGLGEKAAGYCRALHRFLAEDANTRILPVRHPDDPSAITAVEAWAAQWLS